MHIHALSLLGVWVDRNCTHTQTMNTQPKAQKPEATPPEVQNLTGSLQHLTDEFTGAIQLMEKIKSKYRILESLMTSPDVIERVVLQATTNPADAWTTERLSNLAGRARYAADVRDISDKTERLTEVFRFMLAEMCPSVHPDDIGKLLRIVTNEDFPSPETKKRAQKKRKTRNE